jgi:hypothetical protein
VAEVLEAVLAGDFFLGVANGAGDVDQDDVITFFADEVIVVFPGVAELVVAA